MKTLHGTEYPHEGGCVGCRAARLCNACGASVTRFARCTNGRCLTCHAKHCTPGGDTSPGHGYGEIGRQAAERMKEGR